MPLSQARVIWNGSDKVGETPPNKVPHAGLHEIEAEEITRLKM